jgi:hypothetical protein
VAATFIFVLVNALDVREDLTQADVKILIWPGRCEIRSAIQIQEEYDTL